MHNLDRGPMSNVVILFSGQGAQKVGMGQDLVDSYPVAKELFAKANEALGYSLSEVMFSGPDEKLTRTAYCQPALYLHGLTCLEILKEKVPALKPVAAAGLSLGCLLYTSPSPRDKRQSRMPSSA